MLCILLCRNSALQHESECVMFFWQCHLMVDMFLQDVQPICTVLLRFWRWISSRNSSAQAALSTWGLSFENKLLNMTGRVLPTERIEQGGRTVRGTTACTENRSVCIPQSCWVVYFVFLFMSVQYEYNPWTADWSKEMRGLALISSMPLENWLMFYTRRNADVAHSLLQTLGKVSGPMGIRLQRAGMWVSTSDRLF